LESADGLHLPIEQYLATESETNEIQAAQQLLTVRCMATFGFAFSYPSQPPVTGQDPDAANMSRRYGISDPQVVAVYGYQPPPRPTPPVDDLQSGISEAEYDVLFGRTEASSGDSAMGSGSGVVTTTPGGARIPAGGCGGQADREMVPGAAPKNAPLNPGLPIAEVINTESLTKSEADPTVMAVIKAWSVCMAKSGYTESSPETAGVQYPPSLPASAAQIAEAKTDLACKAQTNLISIWVGAETRIQNTLIAQNQAALDQGLQGLTTNVARAAAVLG